MSWSIKYVLHIICNLLPSCLLVICLLWKTYCLSVSLLVCTLSFCSLHNERSLSPLLVGLSVPTGTVPASAGVFVPLLFDIYFTAFLWEAGMGVERQTAPF